MRHIVNVTHDSRPTCLSIHMSSAKLNVMPRLRAWKVREKGVTAAQIRPYIHERNVVLFYMGAHVQINHI